MSNTATRPLHAIAAEIRRDWRPMYFAAIPYVEAMSHLETVNDAYLAESGKAIVLYFLGNTETWRGSTAKRVKAELREMVK